VTGAKVGGWASGDEMAGVVGVDEMDEVVVGITGEVEDDEAGQTDGLTDAKWVDAREGDGATTVSKGGGSRMMRGYREPYRGAGDTDRDEVALAMREEEGELSGEGDTNREVG